MYLWLGMQDVCSHVDLIPRSYIVFCVFVFLSLYKR